MSKIYLVDEYDGDRPQIIAAFSTRELADQHVDKLNKAQTSRQDWMGKEYCCTVDYSVVEMEIDELVPHVLRQVYSVTIDIDSGAVTEQEKQALKLVSPSDDGNADVCFQSIISESYLGFAHALKLAKEKLPEARKELAEQRASPPTPQTGQPNAYPFAVNEPF